MNHGHVARTAGLVITTAIASAAIQHMPADGLSLVLLTIMIVTIGAGLAAIAASEEPI
jgi:hypothetical protein